MRISDTRSHSLGNGTSHHEFEEVFGRFCVVVWFIESNSGGYQSSFNCFVNYKVHNSLGYSKIRGRNTFIETFDALFMNIIQTMNIIFF